jgi:hypothetical protein
LEVKNSYSGPELDAKPEGTCERGVEMPSVPHDVEPRLESTVAGSGLRLVAGVGTIGAFAV